MLTTARILVLDGNQPLEDRACRLVRLRDGRPAAIWRGLAYPLTDSEAIDISAVGIPPSECLPAQGSELIKGPDRRWGIVEGMEEAWVLVAGTVADRDTVALRLKQAGIAVLRSGAWLGEATEGLDADWFVRIARPARGAALEPLLAPILGEQVAPSRPDGIAPEDLRRQLMTAEFDRARAEAAALRAEAERLRAGAADVSELAARVAALKAELEYAKRDLEQERMASTSPQATSPASAASPLITQAPQRLARRLHEEVSTVLESLLPGVRLLRDSLTVASAEFRDRAAFYRALRELADSAARLPPAWRKVRGAEGWWERHVSTGEDDAGRAYVRSSAGGSGWEVLLSHKAEQPRDIAWLRSRR